MFIKSKLNGKRLGSFLIPEKGISFFIVRFLAAKSEEIKSKTKNLDAVGTGLKETVSKIKPVELAELPVEKEKSLQNLFQTLYAVLYHEKKSNFDWKSFRKLALKH